MARSTYIYAIVNPLQCGGHPRAVFTVKHEALTWFRAQNPELQRRLEAWRYRDSAPSCQPVRVDLDAENA